MFVICIRLHVLKASSCVSQTEPCFLTNHFHYAHCLHILLASLSEPHSMLGLQEFVCLSKCLLWTSVYSSVTIHTRTCTSTITVMSHACLYLCTFVLSDIMYTSNHNSHTHLAITAPPPSNPTMPKLCAETEQ